MRVCAIGAARFESGRETGTFESLVRVEGAIHFSRIHRLTRLDLADAPRWPEVWERFLAFLGGMTTLVAYEAAFDRGAILTMCANCGIRMPRLHFECAAQLVERRLRFRPDLSFALESLGIPFPGTPHDALSDARAAAAVALACRAGQ